MSNLERPIASVIVLTYNQQHTISRTLDSILAQRVDFTYEIILGEDASPSDDTRAVCEAYVAKYPDKIYLMPACANKGLMRNFKDCLDQTRGRYIAVCAGDDWWSDPDKLQLQVDFLEANPDYVLVYGGAVIHNALTGAETTVHPTPASDNTFEQLARGNFINVATTCYRAEVAKRIDFEKFISLGFMMEDLPMWFSMAKEGKFHPLDRFLVTYVLNVGSISNATTIDRRIEFEKNVLFVVRYFTLDDPRIDQRKVNQQYHRSLVNVGVKYGSWSFTMRNMWSIGRWKSKDWRRFVKLIVPFGFGILYRRANR